MFLSEMLDGKEVTETAKQFLQNWQANKDAVKRRRDSGVTRENSQLHTDMNGGKEARVHMQCSGGSSIGWCTPHPLISENIAFSCIFRIKVKPFFKWSFFRPKCGLRPLL